MPNIKRVVIKNGSLDTIAKTEHVMSGEDTITKIAKLSPTISLSFSCGKDSIGAWLALHGKFKRIIPVYFYLVPDLEFIERSIRYYEKEFGQHVYRVPHPNLYSMLRNGTWQPPGRLAIIDAFNLPTPDHEEMKELALGDAGIKERVYGAVGVRATDTPMRYTTVKKYGSIRETSMTFYPIWDWKKAYLMQRIKQSGLRVPDDYLMFGKSFDGVNDQYLSKIKEHHPADYKRILEWFPLAHLDGMRRRLDGWQKANVKKR